MGLAAAAEYALMLTGAGPQPATADGPAAGGAAVAAAAGVGKLSPRERELVTLVARGTPTRRSPASCTSACARPARTWTASGTRPDAGAAPTSPAWPSAPAWSTAAWSHAACLAGQPPGTRRCGGFHPGHGRAARGAKRPLPR